MQKAVIYCRVSSAEQVDGTSLATQESACRDWCRREGYEVATVYVERGESAKTADRPEFLRMVAAVQKRRDVARVVVYRSDRFARSVEDYMAFRRRLRDAGAIIASVTEPIMDGPVGAMMETMLSGFAQLDNDIRSARATEAAKAIKAKGGWVHRPPFGFRLVRRADGTPVLAEDEAAALLIRRAYQLVAAGSNIEAVYKAVDAPIGRSAFYRAFRDPLYAQIDPGGFELVQTAIGSAPARSRRAVDFPLRGLFSCGVCGCKLTASMAKGRFAYYHCRRPGHARLSAARINDAVAGLLSGISAGFASNIDMIQIALERRAHIESAEALAIIGAIEDELQDLKRQEHRAVDAMLKGRIDGATYDRKRAEIARLVASREATLAQCRDIEQDMAGMLMAAREYLVDLPTLWNKCQAPDRHSMLFGLFPRGIVAVGNKVRTEPSDSVFGDLCNKSLEEFGMAPPIGFRSNLLAGLRVILEVAA